MKKVATMFCLVSVCGLTLMAQKTSDNPFKPSTSAPDSTFCGKKLTWHDEFNDKKGTKPNPHQWSFEKGFVRNEEPQWYTDCNAATDGKGNMVIVGKVEKIKNNRYVAGSESWKTNREYAPYTSSSIRTKGKFSFKYGTLLVRAKIPTARGAWPAIWTLGMQYEWPLNGEVDLMEYYIKNGQPSILANCAWGGKVRHRPIWHSEVYPFTRFLAKDPQWADKYHVWRMDWTKDYIRIYLDDELLNETQLTKTINRVGNGLAGEGLNAFAQEQYILLNLALGANGGDVDEAKCPMRYYIDYVRVYQ